MASVGEAASARYLVCGTEFITGEKKYFNKNCGSVYTSVTSIRFAFLILNCGGGGFEIFDDVQLGISNARFTFTLIISRRAAAPDVVLHVVCRMLSWFILDVI